MDCVLFESPSICKNIPTYKQSGFASAKAFTNSNNYSVVSMIKIMILNLLHDTTIIRHWCHLDFTIKKYVPTSL